jgi:hypothetical protein
MKSLPLVADLDPDGAFVIPLYWPPIGQWIRLRLFGMSEAEQCAWPRGRLTVLRAMGDQRPPEA